MASFNKEKVLIRAFFRHCATSRRFIDSSRLVTGAGSPDTGAGWLHCTWWSCLTEHTNMEWGVLVLVAPHWTSDQMIVILFLRLREFLVLTPEIVTMINSNQAPINNTASISFLPLWSSWSVVPGSWLCQVPTDMWKHNLLNTSFISRQDINTGWRLVISNFTVFSLLPPPLPAPQPICLLIM